MPSELRPPNILLIMSDEHDAAVSGCYGDGVARTPNLDRLAAEGIRFDSCYTPSPLCVPARQSFTACQYTSRLGTWNLDTCIRDDDMVSLPGALNQAGYESYLCGKMHYDARYRYGFTEIWEDPQNQCHMTGRGTRRAYDDESVNSQVWARRAADFHTGDDSKYMRHDRRVGAEAARFLAERSADAPPFFLVAGYLTPHFPLIAPEELYLHYRGRIPDPTLPSGWLERLPTNYRHLRRGFGIPDATPEQIRVGREFYWALTEWMDTKIGELLTALASSPHASNTVVVYTSDHGENKGDHGLWWKSSVCEHSARVPAIIRYPQRWKGGQVRDGACSLLDIGATLADLAGAEPAAEWDGRSMLPWLDDPRAPWRDFALSEYYGHHIASGYTMVRQGRFKYVYHSRFDPELAGERELYDLSADPGE